MENFDQEFDDEWSEQDLQQFSDEHYDPELMFKINESVDLINLSDKDNVQKVQIINGPEKDQIAQLCRVQRDVCMDISRHVRS